MGFNTTNVISIGKDGCAKDFLISMSRPLDFEENTEASDYIVDNYYKLQDFVRRECGNKVADPAELVHEVWHSIKRAEQIGCGYDPNKGNKDDYITVGQFVYGRLSKYCMKVKFKTNGALTRYEDEVDRMSEGDGVDRAVVDFVTGGDRRIIKNRNASQEVNAFSSDDLQYIYENASDESSEQAYERIEDFESIHSSIEELFNYDDDRVDMKPFLKNLVKLCSKDISVAKMRQMFSGMIEFAKEQDYFSESLYDVITFAIKYPGEYQRIVATL